MNDPANTKQQGLVNRVRAFLKRPSTLYTATLLLKALKAILKVYDYFDN